MNNVGVQEQQRQSLTLEASTGAMGEVNSVAHTALAGQFAEGENTVARLETTIRRLTERCLRQQRRLS